jgi:hypothetical protein
MGVCVCAAFCAAWCIPVVTLARCCQWQAYAASLLYMWPRKCHCVPPQGAGAEQVCQGALQSEHLHFSLTTGLCHILT